MKGGCVSCWSNLKLREQWRDSALLTNPKPLSFLSMLRSQLSKTDNKLTTFLVYIGAVLLHRISKTFKEVNRWSKNSYMMYSTIVDITVA